MRLFEIQMQKLILDQPESIIEYIETHAAPYIRQNQNWRDIPLYRGLNETSDEPFIMPEVKNRLPKNTNPNLSILIDSAMLDYGLTAIRSNSIFVSSSRSAASNYGNQLYSVIPLGDFTFTWSSKIYDLFIYADKLYREGYVQFDERQDIKLDASKLPKEFLKKNPELFTDKSELSLREIFNYKGINEYKRIKSDFYYFVNNNRLLDFILDAGYHFVDIKIKNFLKEFDFTNTDFQSAITSDHEILINAKSCLYIPLSVWINYIERN